MTAAAAPLPLTVIGGFLGAGKTTLLNGLLRALPAGRRTAVLVNDFGAVNVDAALVAARSADTIALTNGCVCCSIGGDLTAALIRVLDACPAFDAVVVEASGVSDPWKIAQLGWAEPGLVLEGIVVVLDATAVLAHAADARLAETLQRQVRCADLLVINRAGDPLAQVDAVRAWAAGPAPGAPVLTTDHGEVPADLLHWGATPGGPAPHDDHRQDHGHDHGHGHGHGHGHQFETWLARPQQVLSADALRAALECMPPGVLRCKGLVCTDSLGWTEVQFAGRHGLLRPAEAPGCGAALVAIGLRGALPRAALERWLSSAA